MDTVGVSQVCEATVMMRPSAVSLSLSLLQPMMDRNKAEELPKLQCGFIDFVCAFVYKVRAHPLRHPQLLLPPR